MPIYEYQCLDCQKDHEIIKKFSDKPLKICPACGGKLKKKLSLSAFQLKGEGWYKDGYSSKRPEKIASPPATKESTQSSQTETPPPASGGPAESPKKERPDLKPAKASSPPPASKS